MDRRPPFDTSELMKLWIPVMPRTRGDFVYRNVNIQTGDRIAPHVSELYAPDFRAIGAEALIDWLAARSHRETFDEAIGVALADAPPVRLAWQRYGRSAATSIIVRREPSEQIESFSVLISGVDDADDTAALAAAQAQLGMQLPNVDPPAVCYAVTPPDPPNRAAFQFAELAIASEFFRIARGG